MRRLLVLFVFLSLIAAACGDDGSSADAGTDDTSDSTGDSTGDNDGGDDGGDDSGDSSGDDDGDDSGDDDGGGAGAGSSFCDSYSAEVDRVDGVDMLTATPEELEDAFRADVEAVKDIADSAPGEISDDVDTIASSFEDLIEELEAVDWNFLAVDTNGPAFDNPEAEAASNRVDAYCGVEDDDPGIPGSIDPDLVEDLENLDPEDAEAFGIRIFMGLGHDEETARCLVEELGADFDADNAGPDIISQEFCGLTFLEIFSSGG